MDGRGVLRHYNLVNVSGEDIDLILTESDGEQRTVVFEKDETIYGVLTRTVERMRRTDPSVLRFVRLEPVYAEQPRPHEVKKTNWLKEGF